MKVRVKITIWYAVILIAILLISLIVYYNVSKSYIDTQVETTLDNVVRSDLKDVDIAKSGTYSEKDAQEIINLDAHYDLVVGKGFLSEFNDVNVGIYDDKTYLYGQEDSTFSAYYGTGEILEVEDGGNLKYAISEEFTKYGRTIYIYGTVSEADAQEVISKGMAVGRWLIPILVLIGLIGGYGISHKVLAPIRRISMAAEKVRDSGDLHERLEIDSNDELGDLEQNFNQMFDYVEMAFDRERNFMSNVSHELRTPIAVIKAQCEYMALADNIDDEMKEDLTIISGQCDDMAGIIRSLREVNNLLRNIKKDDFDLSQSVRDMVYVVGVEYPDFQIKCEIDRDYVYSGDKILIERMIRNILDNAIKYSDKEKFVEISLIKGVLKIRDTGIGIDELDKEEIFRPFYKANTSRHDDGSGLGLSFVKDIADAHNLEIEIESALGKGTCFIIKMVEDYE
ncbi:MAG: HAMP domain-containing histidine kinase [Clostridia bacterium]|nr:HAMP domain-containing histidine kinase [Clostridia bacterium]